MTSLAQVPLLFRFSLYGFLKNQRYFEPFLMLVLLHHGFSFFVIGLLIAARDLTVNLLEIPSGAIADSVGRRGSMMVSLTAYIISFIVLGSANSLSLFFVGMILYGIGDTFRTGTHKAMIFEWLRLQDRTNERTKIYGFTRSWSQIGSAVSGIIAASFVLFTGNFESVFFFATIPYLLNLINLATYPAALNGAHEKATTLGETVRRLKNSLLKAFRSRPLRRLMVESMGWEGVADSIKDYLQPVLAIVAVGFVAQWWHGPEVTSFRQAISGTHDESGLNESQTTALLIGPVYAVLFLLSAWASRHAQSWVDWSGDETSASRRLWLANLIGYIVVAVAAFCQWNVLLVLGFVLLGTLTNFWRPILITRFDSHSDPAEGATILSIESQSQRFATMLLAPALGKLIDAAGTWHPGSEFWPIGVVGAIVSLVLWKTSQVNSFSPGDAEK